GVLRRKRSAEGPGRSATRGVQENARRPGVHRRDAEDQSRSEPARPGGNRRRGREGLRDAEGSPRGAGGVAGAAVTPPAVIASEAKQSRFVIARPAVAGRSNLEIASLRSQ